MANDSLKEKGPRDVPSERPLSEVNDPAGDTGLYGLANECLAIKPDVFRLSLQDALSERLEQAHAVIQMIQMLTCDAAEKGSPSDSIIASASWAAAMLIEQAKQFLAELTTKIGTDSGRPGSSGHSPREGMAGSNGGRSPP